MLSCKHLHMNTRSDVQVKYTTYPYPRQELFSPYFISLQIWISYMAPLKNVDSVPNLFQELRRHLILFLFYFFQSLPLLIMTIETEELPAPAPLLSLPDSFSSQRRRFIHAPCVFYINFNFTHSYSYLAPKISKAFLYFSNLSKSCGVISTKRLGSEL